MYSMNKNVAVAYYHYSQYWFCRLAACIVAKSTNKAVSHLITDIVLS